MARAFDVFRLLPTPDPFVDRRVVRAEKRREHARRMREMAEIRVELEEVERREQQDAEFSRAYREAFKHLYQLADQTGASGVSSRAHDRYSQVHETKEDAEAHVEEWELYHRYTEARKEARSLRREDPWLRLALPPDEADAEGLAQDWEAVGQDVQRAIMIVGAEIDYEEQAESQMQRRDRRASRRRRQRGESRNDTTEDSPFAYAR